MKYNPHLLVFAVLAFLLGTAITVFNEKKHRGRFWTGISVMIVTGLYISATILIMAAI